MVHGEDSSSQNVKTVRTIKQGAVGRFCIELSDGSSFFVSGEFLTSSDLAIGRDITETFESELIAQDSRLAAYDKSIDLLTRRDHSAFELTNKLRTRGFQRDAIQSAVDVLISEGYLDDARFAENWIRSRLKRHPEGRINLASGLAKKGVDRNVAQTALDEMYDESVAADALERAASKITRGRDVDFDVLLKKLNARGFAYRRVTAYLQNLK